MDKLPRITRTVGESPYKLDNLVVWSDLDESTVDAEITGQVAFYTELGHDFEWRLCTHDRPADLVDRLLAQGFEHESEQRALVLASDDPALQRALPEGVELRRITSGADLADLLDVQGQVWGHAQRGWLARFLTGIAEDAPETGIVLAAYLHGEPVGGAWARFGPQRTFAPLMGGSVLPEARGRGIYRAMIAERARAAAAAGTPYLTVDAGPASRPILAAVGFTEFASGISLRYDMQR